MAGALTTRRTKAFQQGSRWIFRALILAPLALCSRSGRIHNPSQVPTTVPPLRHRDPGHALPPCHR